MIRTTGQQIPVEGVKGNAGMGVTEHRAVWDCACSPERPSERKMNALIDDCSSGKWATSGGEELGHCFQRSAVMAFERKTEATFSILKTELYVKAGGGLFCRWVGSGRGKQALVLRWASAPELRTFRKDNGDSCTGCFCIGSAPIPAREVFVLLFN